LETAFVSFFPKSIPVWETTKHRAKKKKNYISQIDAVLYMLFKKKRKKERKKIVFCF
jgi:hypothetical protein